MTNDQKLSAEEILRIAVPKPHLRSSAFFASDVENAAEQVVFTAQEYVRPWEFIAAVIKRLEEEK